MVNSVLKPLTRLNDIYSKFIANPLTTVPSPLPPPSSFSTIEVPMTLKEKTESNLGATINRFGLNVGVRKKRVERR